MTYIKKELETLLYLEEIIQAYEEIASIRMQKVKKSVLSNRAFLDGMRKLAIEVRTSYKKELAHLPKKTNGKSVVVFLSSNTGLYGDIINKVFRAFMTYLESSPNSDIVIVGKTGRRMFEVLNKSSSFTTPTYFDLSDSSTDKENIGKLLNYVIDYSDIKVFHGLFIDMLRQEPIGQTMTGEHALDDSRVKVAHREYIFEPSLEELVAYFEQEILRSMFKHSVHESNLSKYASRMISLDIATERINSKITEGRMTFQREHHRIQSSKQNATLASIYGRIKHVRTTR